MLLKSGRMLFVSLSILTIVLPRFSAAKNWNSTSGNWSESAKWTPSGVPGNGDAVNIVFTNGVARTVTYDYSGGLAVTIDSLSVDLTGAGGNATTLSIPGNTLHANQERIGIDGIGTINQTGGTNLIETNGLALGFNNAGIGNYSLDVGTLSVAGDENIGFSGQGVFTQTSGSNTSANLYLGTNTTGMGTYTLSGGTLQPNNEVVGALGTGNITQAGGTFIQNGGTNNTGFLSIGGNIGATGSYTLNAGSLIAGTLNVGSQGGTGSFTQAGGSQTSAELNVGSDLGSNGTYALSGGIATAADVNIGGGIFGSGGTGSMTVSGANTVLNVSGTIAILNTPNSKFTFSSGTVNANAIDVSGTPSLFSWTGGTLNITTDVTWDSGGAPNSTSVIFGNGITLTSGKTLNVAGNETIGGSGTFAMTLNSNAVHAVTGDITLKAGGIFSETVTSFLSYNNFIHAGGTLGGTFHNIATYIYQSGSFSNVQFINDGPALFSGSASINGSVQNNDQINLTAGQSFSASGITNSGTFNMNGATIGSGGTFTNSVNGTINAKGTINSTLINHGILNVSGALNLTNGLTNNDGVISGGGTISGAPVSNAAGGVITGDSFNSTLTIANFLSNAAGGIMNVNFGSSLSLTSSWTNTGLVNLNGSQARLGGGTIANNGTIQGAGSINAALNNSSGIVRANGGEIDFAGSVSGPGQFQATANSTLMFLQGLSSNGGTITLTGGTLDNNNHALTNSHIISGYGTLRTSSLNNAASQLISIAEGNMDVFGSFTNNGVVNIQSGRSAYFYGAVNGSGSFTGTGTAVFLTGLSPGNSPATVTMSGGATLVGGTSLSMELGGATAGTQYDQLHVGGELSIGGILAVSLINGFVPAVGSSFDLLDWGTLSGTFSTLSLPTLAGAQWDTSKLYTTGVLSVVAGATLPGDYNNNGVVDAADYVVWRAGLGTIYVQNDYNVWRAHFGQTAGSGSSLSASGSASVAVPEPASAILMLCGVAAVAFSNRRRSKS